MAKQYEKHGHYIGSKCTSTRNIWSHMQDRCTNPKSPKFHRYGGRGIKVCKRWQSFIFFLKDIGECPKGCSIDRIDNDKSYSPENCRWADQKTQQNNRTNNRFATINGETKPLVEWSKLLGLKYGTLYKRYVIKKKNEKNNQDTSESSKLQ